MFRGNYLQDSRGFGVITPRVLGGGICPQDSRGGIYPQDSGGVNNPNNPPYIRHWLEAEKASAVRVILGNPINRRIDFFCNDSILSIFLFEVIIRNVESKF